MRFSNCRAKKRQWLLRRNSCSFTRISPRVGKGYANCEHLPPDAETRQGSRMTADETHRAVLAVWRIEQTRLITNLARMVRDAPLAEDVTQEALWAALGRCPLTGAPEKPGAGLRATSRRRALDHLRRRRML